MSTYSKSGTHHVFEEHIPGWPGSGFDRRQTKLSVRRVNREGTLEAQIEIQIAEVRGSRLYRHFGSLTLSPEQAQQLADALLIEFKQTEAR